MLKIKYVATESLKPYDNNSKIHPETQISQIKKSIGELGFFEPVLIDENKTVLSGHARLQAMIELEEAKIPTISLEGLTENQKRKAIIAANKIQENGAWDKDALIADLQKILEENPSDDLQAAGFTVDELNALINRDQDFDFSDDNYSGNNEAEEYQSAIIQYVLIFDDEEQQRIWHQHLTNLKEMYPEEPTIASRIAKFINEAA